jgi:hypothetical protein
MQDHQLIMRCRFCGVIWEHGCQQATAAMRELASKNKPRKGNLKYQASLAKARQAKGKKS